MPFKQQVLVFSLFGITSGMMAQEADAVTEMITDRPDATESPNTVHPGWLQVETGAFYTEFENNQNITEKIKGYNTTLLRFGVLENVELRLGWNFIETVTEVDNFALNNIASGLTPLLAGMKIYITEEKGLLPEIGLVGHVFLPFSASTDYQPETTGVDFRFAMAHTLSEKSSLGYNLGAQWRNDASEASYVYTLSYGYSLTDKLGAYVEVYGDFPEDSKANHLWDAGFTYSIKNNIQLDLTFGRSFTKGQNILISGGVSFRIPR